jgi:hypothetical protein
MNTLPKVLEDIILYHQKFLDHQEKNKKILKEIKQIEFKIHNGDTWRGMNRLRGYRVQYYGGLNRANNWRDSTYELWVHRYTDKYPDDPDEELEEVMYYIPELEEIKIIMEDYNCVDIVNG